MARDQGLAAVLVTVDRQPDSTEFEGVTSRTERLDRMRAFYAKAGKELRNLVAQYQVEVDDLEALGSWTVRGPRPAIRRLADSGGALAQRGFHVAQDDLFFV